MEAANDRPSMEGYLLKNSGGKKDRKGRDVMRRSSLGATERSSCLHAQSAMHRSLSASFLRAVLMCLAKRVPTHKRVATPKLAKQNILSKNSVYTVIVSG